MKLSVWKALQPLFSLQCVFAFDLEHASELSSGIRQLPQGTTVSILRGLDDLEPASAALRLAAMPSSTIKRRLTRGDAVAVAFVGKELAAYTWVTFKEVWISEIRRTLVLRDDEAVQFDTLVMPRWRGKGLQYGLTLPVLQDLAQRKYRRTLAWVNWFNQRSMKNQIRQGKRRISTIISVPAVDLVWLRNIPPEAPLTLLSSSPEFI
jgi:hypothetical protein